jgi:aquaporin Z
MVDVNKFLAEFVGTFVFLSVILATGQAIPIGVALAAVIFMISRVSGGHVNPAVSIISYANGDLSGTDLVTYVVAQVLGGLCAIAWYKKSSR